MIPSSSSSFVTRLLLSSLLLAAAARGQTMSANLLVNGGAENGVPSGDGGGDVVVVPGWTTIGDATVVTYGSSGGFPQLTDPGPDDRGVQFFAGGPSNEESSMVQTVNVTAFAGSIDRGGVQAVLSGYLGGFDSQDDSTTVTAIFLDGSGTELGRMTIGPVSAGDRGNALGLLPRSQTAATPALTRSIQVTMDFLRADGSYNDGYADNMSLTLGAQPDQTVQTLPALRISPTHVTTSVNGVDEIDPAVKLDFPTETGKTYQVQRSGNMTLWELLQAPVSGTGQMMSVTDPTGPSQRFYRLVISQ